MDKAYILIIDDHKMVRESLVQVLKMFFSDVRGISNPNQLNSLIAEKEPDVILLDMNFSAGINTGNEGIFWLKEIKKQSAGIQVITITAYGEIDLAVRAIKEGAHYFIQKPWENELLIKTVNTALELRRKSLEVDLLSKQRNDLIEMVNRDYEPMIGNSGPMLKIKEIAAKVAVTDANILITGENGTGKGLLARYIHSLSERKESPFISVDLGSIPESLFESELFGHKKGAFTDAREDRSGRIQTANAGTLFLDEIANIPVYLQSKLLNVVQERKVTPLGSNKEIETDIRLICATNRDLKQMVTDNLFREDLFFRINTIELKIPALRERMDDVPLLTDYYLEYYSNKYGKEGIKFTNDAWNKLISYSWPGNIRELRHHIEKGVILSNNVRITQADLQLYPGGEAKEPPLTLDEIEKKSIIDAINRHKGSIREAAKELQVSRQTLYNKIEKYRIR